MKKSSIHSPGFWAETWRRLKKNYLAMFGIAVVIAMFILAILAPLIANNRPLAMKAQDGLRFPAFRQFLPGILDRNYARVDWRHPEEHFKGIEWKIMPPIPYGSDETDLPRRYEGPSGEHLFGTDDRGRDIASRLVWGTRISITVGIIATGLAVLIGIPLGLLAGYYGGWVDFLISRIIEIVICFPTFFLILTILAFLPQSIYNIMIVLGLTGWVGPARLIRGETLKIRTVQYIEASRAMGAKSSRIIFRHIFPNAVGPVLVSAAFGIAGAILTESGLSFLGFGVPPPTASWGEVISQGERFIDAWWLTLFPGAAIFLTVTAYNLLGEGFRDATDPRLREAGGR